MSSRFTATVPGNLMMLGEHAVLHGRRALVCAVTQYMRITLTPRKDRRIRIESELGHYETEIDKLDIQPPFRFVLVAIQRCLDRLPSGFDLTIESEFSDQIGLGSSAAVTAGTLAVAHAFAGAPLAPDALFDSSLSVVREIQGMGSGADVAASVFGGIVEYRSSPREIKPLGAVHPITVIYSGSKERTVTVVEHVDRLRAKHEVVFDHIFDLMDQSVGDAADAIQRGDWSRAGELMNINQGFMDAIGVNTGVLSEIIYALRKEPGILGAKISGAGRGDCVIALGSLGDPDFMYHRVNVQISPEGLRLDH